MIYVISLLCITIDVARFILGVYNLLAAVKAVVSGKKIAYCDCKYAIMYRPCSKHLNSHEKRCNRAVRNAAEDGDHGERSAERGREPEHGADHRAEGRAREEGRDDLAALEARAERDRGEKNFQQEGAVIGAALEGGGDDRAAGAVIVARAAQQSQRDHERAADRGAGGLVRDVAVIERRGGAHELAEDD